jgi:hypothetical protein
MIEFYLTYWEWLIDLLWKAFVWPGLSWPFRLVWWSVLVIVGAYWIVRPTEANNHASTARYAYEPDLTPITAEMEERREMLGERRRLEIIQRYRENPIGAVRELRDELQHNGYPRRACYERAQEVVAECFRECGEPVPERLQHIPPQPPENRDVYL